MAHGNGCMHCRGSSTARANANTASQEAQKNSQTHAKSLAAEHPDAELTPHGTTKAEAFVPANRPSEPPLEN